MQIFISIYKDFWEGEKMHESDTDTDQKRKKKEIKKLAVKFRD